jgi:hypothetical protein
MKRFCGDSRIVQDPSSKVCLYCDRIKSPLEFSLEHIWPDALGGDFLPELFQTRQVCERCNNLAGRFVDGAFLKSWFGMAERASGWEHYIDLNVDSRSIVSLNYMGPLADAPCSPEQICEMWIGPCGVHVIHFRDQDEEDTWHTYAGGDPVARARRPGRVYISLTTKNVQWIALALRSIKAQFKKAKRYIVNAELPAQWAHFAQSVDRQDASQKDDLKVVEFVQDASKKGDYVRHNIKISAIADHRLLAKIALGLGFQILGPQFLSTGYSSNLRCAMWERDPIKRAQIPVRGVGFLNPVDKEAYKLLAFPGAWIIHVKVADDFLALAVVTPAGNSFIMAISDTPDLWKGEQFNTYRDGEVFVVLPQLAKAIGPIPTATYLSHILRNHSYPELSAIEAKRMDRSSLPPCT